MKTFLSTNQTALLIIFISNRIIQVSSWYTGLHGPGTIPDMLLKCFNNNQVPCTPLKTFAAWHDLSRKVGRTKSSSSNGIPIITYSSADGDDITTYIFQGQTFIDSEEISLNNATQYNVYVFCCLENHVEGGTGDS
jgi:hypothetical protein